MNWTLVIWTYIGLLLVGGLMGFIKAGSRASLIASSAIAAVLAALLLSGVSSAVLGGFLCVLSLYFGSRFWKSRKWMPGGIFAIVSVVAAGAIFWLTA